MDLRRLEHLSLECSRFGRRVRKKIGRLDAAPLNYAAWVLKEEARYASLEWHQKEAARWSYQPRISLVLSAPHARTEASIRPQSYTKWELCRAIESASGDYVAVMESADALHPYALHYVVEALQPKDVEAVYTDEDRMNAHGLRTAPLFKPDWSPELLASCEYWGRLLVMKKGLTAAPRRVMHVGRVLYHRGPEAGAFPCKCVPEIRCSGGPLISIVICTCNALLLKSCLSAIEQKTNYAAREFVIVRHVPRESGDIEAVAGRFGAKCVNFSAKFDFAEMCNLGAAQARGEVLLFLNDDTAPLRADWLDTVVVQLQREEIGIIGGKLLYPTGAIQHAGVAYTPAQGAWHIGRGMYGSELFPWIDYPREVSAVTGACLAVRRETFEALRGFDTVFPVNYNDVDFCFRVWERGLRVICDPRVLLRHDESATRPRGTNLHERWLLFERWNHLNRTGDPYYPPVFDYGAEEILLADQGDRRTVASSAVRFTPLSPV